LFYVRNGLPYHTLDKVLDNNNNIEVLFISVRERILSRPLSILIVAVVNSPPWYDAATFFAQLTIFIADILVLVFWLLATSTV
jgi:hypothetical protein